MSKRTYYIDRFDRGIQQSKRAQFEDPRIIGFYKCSHFDIFTDPKRLIPTPGFESQNGNIDVSQGESIPFGPESIGGNAERVYLGGMSLTNWYNSVWEYRVQITPDATYYNGTNTPFTWVDLSNMPADFWTNVQSNGGDIRVTTSDGVSERPIHITEFDAVTQTGNLYIGGLLDTSGFYIYYGNINGNVITGYSEINQYGRNAVFKTFELAYTFDNGDENNDVTRLDGKNLTGSHTDNTSSPVGDGITIANSTSIFCQNPPNPGNSFTFSFLLDLNSNSAEREVVGYGTELQFRIVSGPKLQTIIDYSNDNNETLNSVSNLPTTGYTLVTVAVNGDVVTIWFNKTLEATIDHATSGIINWGNLFYQYISLGAGKWDMFMLSKDIWDTALVETMSDNLQDNGNFWNIGTQEDITSVTLTYGAFQIWTKEHGEIEWYGLTNSSFNQASSPDDGPNSRSQIVPGNNIVGFGTIKSDLNQIGSFTPTTGISPSLRSLIRDRNSFDPNDFVVFALGADNILYGGGNTDKLYAITDGAATEVYDTGKTIRSICSYDDMLVLGTTKANTNVLELFDLARTDPISVIDFGNGELGPIAQVGDYLVGVVINDLEFKSFDEAVAGASPRNGYISIRAAQGNRYKEIFKRDVTVKNDGGEPVIYPYGFVDEGRFKFFFQNHQDEEVGIYEVGFNSAGELVLNVVTDLSVFFTNEIVPFSALRNYWIGNGYAYYLGVSLTDYFLYRQGSTYAAPDAIYGTTTSYFETTTIGADLPQQRKAIREIVVGANPLAAGASIVVKYRKNGDTAWTTLNTMDVDGAIRLRIRRKADGTPLPTFEEAEFRVESTGGAEITEFEVVTEILES